LLKDGTFELIGRRDYQVKVRGERIELGAIETTLRAHEAIKDVVVVDRDDASGTKYLCGYIVASRDVAVPELRDFLANELSPAAIPSAFVTLDAIPRLINGKVDRAALPIPDRDRARAEQTFEAPRTPVEEKLAQLFADVLGVSRVGIHESFFDLGGHSLLATQLVSRIRRGFEIALPVRALFETPTVAGIARHVDAVAWAAQKPAAGASAAVTELEI
jgi:acyl carrier protein